MNEKPRLLATNNTSFDDCHLATKAMMTVSTVAPAESGGYSNKRELRYYWQQEGTKIELETHRLQRRPT